MTGRPHRLPEEGHEAERPLVDDPEVHREVGEDDGDVFMQGLLVADSGETAVRLRSIIEARSISTVPLTWLLSPISR